ncbi:hypothetical protein CEE37_05960 [candidate division LCP-89 bacterium B3_LCP]|uniref:Uncharacterized protein n=1 Tax=candidate division LCP-89 bacterium B3_LCP TaxID=2012998 RepID=A0A532V219_UNCL8|nr:MAG: hypothetical protein CEE37_05960 [candidate division LCP-89 bacterium B3_LCP]
MRTVQIKGQISPEIWNRLGTKIIPKLRSGEQLQIELDFSVKVKQEAAGNFESELQQIINDLGLKDKVSVL